MIDLLTAVAALISLAGIVGVTLLFAMVMRAIARREREDIAELTAGSERYGHGI